MPGNQKKSRATSKTNNQPFDFDEVEDGVCDSATSERCKMQKKNHIRKLARHGEYSNPIQAKPASKSRKRVAVKSPIVDDDDSDSQEEPVTSCDNEMQGLLNSFGADITRTLASKRKRLQSFTQASLKASNRRYDEIFKVQSDARSKLCDEFGKQIASVFTQWESDVQKARENEEKLETLLRQQQKSVQQQRVVQGQRLKSLKQLFDQYIKSCSDLEKVHLGQQTNVNGELKKELAILQKKIMMDTKQEEISSVRKSLQTMLSQV